MRRALAALALALGAGACTPRDAAPPPPAPAFSAAAGTPGDSAASTTPSTGSPGCGRPTTAGARTETISVFGVDRTYLLVVPDGYDPATPHPIVFGLHGNGGTPANVRRALDLEGAAGASRAVFVYPAAKGGGWDLDAEAARNRDVALFDAVLFRLHGSLCVDERRVFVTGFSNGAYMANQLGCRRGERIRAVVTQGGGGPYEVVAGSYDARGQLICPGKAVAALVIHGLGDRVVASSEGDKSVAHWAFANRCGRSVRPYGPTGCVAYDGCAQPVVACRVPGLGHTVWPEARSLTWSFLDALR